ncbi:MAG TPA: DUF5134 domain-containing protein [Galbitalea sp.]|jgi:hypothetical protein
MIGPIWLATIIGVLMIVAAVVAMVRIVVAWRARRASDFEVDIHNVVMGITMAGMLIPSLLIVTAGPSTVAWLIVWILITAWFAVSVIRDASRRAAGHRFTGHHLPHLVMSGAMIYTLVAMAGSSGTAAVAGMSGVDSAETLVFLPTLDFAFVIFMAGYAVLVVDRLPLIAVVGMGALYNFGRPTGAVVPLAPRTAAATNIVMAVAMGYMLTMFFV